MAGGMTESTTGFDNLRVTSPYNIKIIQDLKMEQKPNQHARVYLKGIVDDTVNFNSVINAAYNDEIHIYQTGEKADQTIFKGLAAKVQTTNVNGIYYIEVEGLSGTFQLDIKQKSRSFQDTTLEYPQLLQEIIKDYPGSMFINSVGDGVKIDNPIIQYKETDWELIKRLASRFQSVLICDILENKPRFYFGFPQKDNSITITEDIPYTANKDLIAFNKAGGYEAGYHDTDFFSYEIESGKQYSIGDEIWFRNKQMYISEITAYLDKGLLKYRYRLARLKGIYQEEIYNPGIKGMSLAGKVLDTKDEVVKLHLDIDEEQPKEKACWFPFAPPTNNVMYCMPQIGTIASLYFPDATGNNVKVLGCVRKNGSTCPKTSDPSIRYWGTEHGSELELSPSAINIVSGCKEPLKMTFDDKTGITLTSHKKIVLNAAGDISIYTPKGVIFNAPNKIFFKKTDANSGFSLENEFHFLGSKVILAGRDRTAYQPYQDDPHEASPPNNSSPASNDGSKKGNTSSGNNFDWGKLALNVLGGLAVVAAVTLVAVVAVAAVPAIAAFAGAVAVGAAVGGILGVAGMAVSDVVHRKVSDISDYAKTAFIETTLGAVSGAVLGPVEQLGLTLAKKMAIGGATNAFQSFARQEMEGKGVDPWKVAMDAGIGVATVGIINSKVGKSISNAIDDAAPWIRKGANKILGAIDESANRLASKLQPQLALDGVPNGLVNFANEMDNDFGKNELNELQKNFNKVTKGTGEAAEKATEEAEKDVAKGGEALDVKEYPDGSIRDSKGRFAGKTGTVPGAPGVDKAIEKIKTNPAYDGYEVLGNEISVKNVDGTLRRYDVVCRKPDGQIVGIEVKSGTATRTAQQRTIDNELLNNGGLPTTGDKAKDIGIDRIDTVEVIHVD